MDCALFLMQFLARLAYIYQDLCDKKDSSEEIFDPQLYKESLIKCLNLMSNEDKDKWSCLKELQSILIGIDERLDIGWENQKMFQLNNCDVYKKKYTKSPRNLSALEEYLQEFEYFSDWKN